GAGCMGGGPSLAGSRARHHAILDIFQAAARGNDLASLIDLLSEGVVLRGDGGGKALGLKKPVVGAAAVARFIIAVTRRLPADAFLHKAELNGAPAIVFTSEGRPFVVIMVETEKGRIDRIYAIANPEKLGAVAASWHLHVNSGWSPGGFPSASHE